jgi:dephospho-CoA kinase
VLLVGLTGGIASGKSTVARRLVGLGATVIDADVLAREVVAPGTPGVAAVASIFGTVVAPDGSLDRAALGRIVFADPLARARLNDIIHPAVQRRFAELVQAAPVDSVVVHDVPLLVENGLAPRYHLVVVVHAQTDVRVSRLVQQRAMSTADSQARIAAQATDAERRAVADVWMDNTAGTDELFGAVDALWHERLVPYEENIRHRRRTRRPDQVRLLPHDPAWAGQASRTAARIGWSIREHPAAARCIVEHIGSTSVPGLAAKDVIDLQLAVPDLAVADALEPALSAAGWIRMADNNDDSPKPVDPDPDHWRKRFYGGTDPAVVVHLHVRATGSAGWRYALLFRDWLRADPSARADYEAEKRRVAAATADAMAYAEAKEPWFDEALPRAEAWATAAGWTAPGWPG